MSLPPVFVELRGSIGDLKAKLGEAQNEIDKLAKKGASSFDKMAALGKGALLGLGAGFVTLGAVGIKQAADQEAATAALRQAVENTGRSWKDYAGQVDKAEGAARKLGFSDDEATRSMARLTQATGSPTRAIKDQALAMDIARGRNISLAESTDLLAKVETGHVALLGRLGIATKDAAGNVISQDEAMKRLGATFGGSAAAHAQTFAGKIETLKAQGEELAEKFGNMLIPNVLRLGSAAVSVAGYLDHNRAVAVTLGAAIAGVLVPAMAAYAATQAAAFGASSLAALDHLAGAFLTVGAAVMGLSVDAVVAAGSMSAMWATTAAGALAVAAPLLAAGAAYKVINQAVDDQKSAADKWAAAYLKTNPTIDQRKAKLAELNKEADKGFHLSRAWGDNVLYTNDAAKEAANRSGALARAVDGLNTSEQAANVTTKTATQLADENAQENGFASAEAEKRAQSIDKLRSSLTGLMAAGEAEANANTRVADASQHLADAHAKVNDLVRKGTVDVKAVVQATKEHQRAAEAVAQALKGQQAAQEALDNVMHPAVRTQEEAKIAAAQAADGVVKANIRVRQAEAALAALQKSGTASADELRSAMIDVSEARDAVTTATYASTDAEQRVADLLPGNIELSKAYKDAQTGLDAAKKGVADASDSERDAGEKLRVAQAGDPALAAAITQAKKDEQAAQKDLTGAKDAATKAAYDHATALAAELDALASNSGLVSELQTKLLDLNAIDPAAAPYVQALISLLGSTSHGVSVDKYGNFHGKGGVRGFAAGGRPTPGEVVMVGEHGPEPMVFDRPGTIYPTGTGPASSSSGATSIVINISGAREPEVTGRAVVAALAAHEARNGRR